MLEKIIAKLPTKCKFTEYGCLEEEKLPEEMIRHEQTACSRKTESSEVGASPSDNI